MLRDDIRFELNGFGANSKFGGFVSELIDELHLQAPSDATTASFTKSENFVTGAVQISSSHGVFSASAQGRNARAVVHKVIRDVRKQLH